MPIYAYKATDLSGKITKGSLEADSEKGAVSRLQDMGYIPIRIMPPGGGHQRISEGFALSVTEVFKRSYSRNVMIFTRDLASLLGAGVPIDRALSILMGVTENVRFRLIVEEILKSVQGGSYLSEALSRFPHVFSSLYVNMIRAGEAGGVLAQVMDRLGVFLENSQEMKDYIKSALVYPAFLVCVGGLSIIILMTFVIPKFAVIFSDLGQGVIPLPTRFLLGFSQMFRSYWWVALGTVILFFFAYRQYSGTPDGRMWIDKMKLRFKLTRNWVQKVEMSRFTRTLGTLAQSGVPILRSLELVGDIVSNRVLSGAISSVHDRVKEGTRLSSSMDDTGMFPTLAVQMITVGEETGKLDEMLMKVADNYDKAVRIMVKRFISFLEPAMILIMGVIVGFIVISMLMAIFSINSIPF